jgi:hypothetical protein
MEDIMRYLVFIVLMLLILPDALAVNDIYDFLQNINTKTTLIVTSNNNNSYEAEAAKLFVQRFNTISVINEKEFDEEQDVIALGHPCSNKLVEDFVECLTWPYKDDEVLIKLQDGNLIVAGNGSLVLAVEKMILDKNFFKNVTEIALDEDGIIELKPKLKVRCGDKICTHREEFNCPGDCKERMTCETYCSFFGYLDGRCSGECKAYEKKIGEQNCNEGVCCCKLKEPLVPELGLPDLISPEPGIEIDAPAVVTKRGKKIVDIVPQKENILLLFFRSVFNWIKTLF